MTTKSALTKLSDKLNELELAISEQQRIISELRQAMLDYINELIETLEQKGKV